MTRKIETHLSTAVDDRMASYKGVAIVGILAGAFLVRIVLMLIFRTYHISATEGHYEFGWEAGQIAQSLVEGRGFAAPFVGSISPTAWLAPGYPALLALTFKLFGLFSTTSAFVNFVINSLVATLTCAALYRLGRALFGPPTALLTAALFALYPPSIWHSISTVWDTTWSAFMVVVLLCSLYDLPRSPSLGQCMRLGILMGLILLLNPAIFSFCLAALAWMWLRSHDAASRRAACAGVALICCGITVLPWMVRNLRVLGRFTLKSNIGIELKIGNSPMAFANYAEWMKSHPAMSQKELYLYNQMAEVPYADRCQAEAIMYIKGNPDQFLRLVARRVKLFWFGEGSGNNWTGNLHTGTNLGRVKNFCHWAPLPCAMLGIILAFRNSLQIGPLLLLFAVFPIPYYITHVAERYRFPLEPLVLLIATYGIWSLAKNVEPLFLRACKFVQSRLCIGAFYEL